MLRSMFTAIGSLTMHQTFMDIVSNNIANANTHSYKAVRATFQDQISQLMAVGAAPTATLGGINPTQIGLGTRLGATQGLFTQGTLQATGINTDMAVQGDGFFIYRTPTGNVYSRDGALNIDSDGYLVNNSTGMRIQGWQAVVSGSSATVNTGTPIGDIQIPINATLARATSSAIVRGNLDSTATAGSAGAFTMTMGVYDSLGVLHSVAVTFTPNGGGSNSWAISGSGAGVTLAGGPVTFNSSGQWVSGAGTVTLVPGGGAASPQTIALDFSTVTQLASTSSAALASQDGLAPGFLTGFSTVTNTGEIYGVYSNGLQQLIGQVGLALFVNPTGLMREGQNVFSENLNSGTAQIGQANVNGRGSIINGYLEASNVDMAQEFTNMILAQRGFQASSRIITTSDEMLQELVNLKR